MNRCANDDQISVDSGRQPHNFGIRPPFRDMSLDLVIAIVRQALHVIRYFSL